MKQVVQDFRTGRLQLIDAPPPALRTGGALVQTAFSLVSVGTERSTVALARKTLLGKALSRPDLVRQVLEKARVEGIGEAYRQVRARLEVPVALGYSSAGVVTAVEGPSDGIHVGDRVACSGLGFASHAELCYVPVNMLAPVPDGVSLEAAAFGGVGAIALHGVRAADVGLGSRVVVIGLGLLGLIAVQVLRAAGCHVFGTDLVSERVALARELGAGGGLATDEDVAGAVRAFTRGHGADAVLIATSTTSAKPLELAATVARERAQIVALGMMRLDVPRRLFYEKELRMIVPRSSGPGLYDRRYESKGVDYPIGHVRWTHRRNLDEFLTLLQARQVDVSRLITHHCSIEEAGRAYETIMSDRAVIGLLFTYPQPAAMSAPTVWLREAAPEGRRDRIGVGVVGAGIFATGTLLPVLRALPSVRLRGLVTTTGATARQHGERFGFEYCATDVQQLLDDDAVDALVIVTRNDTHAALVAAGLRRGKAVFVEKPLAVSRDDLAVVLNAWQAVPGRIMVGYNRRFAPLAREARSRLATRAGPTLVHCRVNVGPLPKDSWVRDPREGGGTVVGEMGHFIDLAQYLVGAPTTEVYAQALPGEEGGDDVMATLRFADGSLASILYTVQGDRAFPRERVEAFRGGMVCAIDNFRTLEVVSGGRRRVVRAMGVDRGHRRELEAFVSALKEGRSMPIPFEDYVLTTLTTFAILDSLARHSRCDVKP